MFILNFKQLFVWQRAMELTKSVYQITKELPPEEKHVLSSQLRRASISIPSNIAEGHRRKTKKDFIQFLRIADGSAAEIETQLLMLHELYSMIDIIQAQTLVGEIQKMLSVMIRRLGVV